MPPNESSYPADWARIAEKDWDRSSMLLDAQDPELAGFCLQQAVEKFLKAFLLSKGHALRRIHDVEALLDDALAYRPDLEAFRPACQRITAFYLIERYPLFVQAGIMGDDVRLAREEVADLVAVLRAEVGG